MKKNITIKPGLIRNVLFILLCIVLFFTSMYGVRCAVHDLCDIEMITKYIRHDVTVIMPQGAIQAEVANSKAEREKGLSGRVSMRDSEGILFVFDGPGKYGFWMKDMNFPLDIIWINQNGLVVNVERNLTPDTYPKTFINEIDASYVLELNAGKAKEFGLFLGSKVQIVP